jgi:hypothetical protein
MKTFRFFRVVRNPHRRQRPTLQKQHHQSTQRLKQEEEDQCQKRLMLILLPMLAWHSRTGIRPLIYARRVARLS